MNDNNTTSNIVLQMCYTKIDKVSLKSFEGQFQWMQNQKKENRQTS